MPIFPRLLVPVLFSMLASGPASAAEPESAAGHQAPEAAASAAPVQADAQRVDPASILREPPPPASEAAPELPIRPKGERPKLGLCDGS
jgi:hypothetical protein